MHLFAHTGEARFSLKSLMSFVDLTVFNFSDAQIDNINAGGVDVPAGTSVTATLTNTEALAVAQLNGVIVMQNGATAAELQSAAALLSGESTFGDLLQAAQDAEAGGITLLRERAWAAVDTALSDAQ
jgi:hypothetical protein